MSADTQVLREALRQVIDPEVGVNIVDLGLVYGLDWTDAGVRLDLTMTSPACPMGESILAEAESVLMSKVPEATPISLNLVWEPPWSPELMSDRAREILGWAP
jgi:metal-sulfur cluster biosynthetic enzyme